MLIHGDLHLNFLPYQFDENDISKPKINETRHENYDDTEIDKVLTSGKVAKVAIASKLVAIAYELYWQQIVSKPIFTKPIGDKSYLDRIFTNLHVKDEVMHIRSECTWHDILNLQLRLKLTKRLTMIESRKRKTKHEICQQ